MKKSIFFASILLFIIGTLPSHAQERTLTLSEASSNRSNMIKKSLPFVSRWLGDEQYVETKREGGSLLVDVKTGKKVPYTHPRAKALPLKKKENRTLSPDSTWMAYTENNNLYAEEIATGRKVQYTTDGSDRILNGKASWVYYEEILDHSTATIWWSNDSKYIGFFRSDESKVPLFPIYNAMGQHGSLDEARYPKAGDPNPEVQVGIVNREGGPITWADFNWKDDQYFGKPFWSPDNQSLWVQWMPREQNQLKIYAIDVITGKKTEVYTESQPTWIDWKRNIYFLKKQSAYLIQNDTDGWDQIYLYNNNGNLKTQITKGKKFWNTEIKHIDESRKILYFASCGETSLRKDLYSVKFDGTSLKRLTFGEYDHSVQLSPSAKYFITRYSNTTTPIRIALVNTSNGKIIHEIADSKGESFDSRELNRVENIWYTTSDGLQIPALISYPPNLDTTKLHPVIINIYGGPNAGSVVDRCWWGASSWKSHEGVIAVTLDHRGSGHLGKAGLNYMHRNLGKYEISDYIDFVKQHLYSKSYVDRSKIAIEGHSYGGYLTALAVTKAPEFFKIGIADAGVMDWNLYDSHYTERYMDTPESNPQGYTESSVLNYVKNYPSGENMLLIRHGLADDNVHVQNSIQLIDQMENEKKSFEMMFYPGCGHSFLGKKYSTTQKDVIRFYYRYLLEKEVPQELIKN